MLMLLLLAQAAAVDVRSSWRDGMAEVAQQWKRRQGESVNKVLAVRASVGFDKGLSVGELDDEVLTMGEMVGFN